ncbi:JmjC domain, hydroxylase-domain-containing protein [Baffinella frigidus]|nr:JmjC domain, hydroxylase-domain-containing protein [Cryptophyta sp. CCMP2293]
MECPVFWPSAAEFSDFEGFMRKVEGEVQHVGIARIVPPAGWRAMAATTIDFRLGHPTSQKAIGREGVFWQCNVTVPPATFQQYRAAAMSQDACKGDTAFIEHRFWASLGTEPANGPVYATEHGCSLFDDAAGQWDLRNVKGLLQNNVRPPIPGVTTPTLVAGMWRTFSAWHTEDYDLLALNYLHPFQGAAGKHWYAIPASQHARFERLCDGLFPGQRTSCPAFLRHRTFLVSPAILETAAIPFVRCVQRPGEFVVTFAGVYTAGFSAGFNVSETVNLATPSWIPRGLVLALSQ